MLFFSLGGLVDLNYNCDIIPKEKWSDWYGWK